MRLIDADKVIKSIKQQFCAACDDWNGVRCKVCDAAECICLIDDAPFYTSLENYIEEHGEEIDFMFFAPELAEDGESEKT